MTDSTKIGLVTKNATQNVPGENVLINELRIIPVDRTRKDIRDWVDGLKNAEYVYQPNRRLLYDIYSRVILDPHLSGLIDKRVMAVSNKVVRYVKDNKEIEGIRPFIKSKVFRDIVKEIMLSKMWGISGMEFIPGQKVNFEGIPRKHIKPNMGLITVDQNGIDGYAYADISNIWVVGDRNDLGLLVKVTPFVLWKQGNMADWAQFVELFGQPVRVARYDGYDVKTQMELKRALDEAGSSLALMIPKQAEFQILDGKTTNGDGSLQNTLKDACNEEMSVCILGNTETTKSSKSSGYAQSDTHHKEQLEVTKSDIMDVTNYLNDDRFTAILKSYGLPVQDGGLFEFQKEVNLSELQDRIKIDMQVAQRVPVGDDYFYETYGIPKPENYNELKEAAKGSPPGDPPGDDDQEDVEPGETDDPNPSGSGNKGGVKKPGKAFAEDKLWYRMRAALADFFDPALRRGGFPGRL
jgi:hypothetical protein